MNAPAETAPANTAYLKVLEALVQINEPAERERIATKAGISPDDAGVQLVALIGKRIVVRCPQPKGAPALWSLAVSLDTARQMVAGMKHAAAEASPAADYRRRIIAAMREIGAPASAFGIAKKSGVDLSVVSVMLEAMAADGVIRRIGGTSGQRPKFALIPSVQSQTPTATDGEPGDGAPDEDHEDEDTAAAADPDDYGDDEDPAADDRPGSLLAVADGIAAAVAAGECPTLDTVTIVSASDVRADWVMRHTDHAQAAPADPDTPLECAIARVTAPLLRQAEEWETQALESRHIVFEAIRLANEAKARTPGTTEAHRALLLAAEIIKDVQE